MIDNPAYYKQSRVEMLEFIPENAKTFLEIGCADGTFGKLIKSRQQSVVWGVEPVKEIAETAHANIDKVISSPIEDSLAELPENYFDCVVCNDVLEHLSYPDQLLEKLRKHLSEGSLIVGSIPNVRYFPVIYDLIVHSDWKYVEYGVLDRTHLRFYTRKSLFRFLEEAGYSNIKIKGINPTTGIKARLLSIFSIGFFRDCLYQQYAFTASPVRN